MKKALTVFVLLLSALFLSCATDAEDEFDASKVCPVSKRGTFVDARDGRVYKYTTIGDQVWMAQNLNYESIGSICNYEDDNCLTMGRTYGFDYTLCPTGWHVPSKDEWSQLFDAVGGEEQARNRLRTTYGWNPLNPEDEANGTDDCGFGVAFANYGYDDHYFDTAFLTSTRGVNNGDTVCSDIYFCSYDRHYIHHSTICGSPEDYRSSKRYLRCVKD